MLEVILMLVMLMLFLVIYMNINSNIVFIVEILVGEEVIRICVILRKVWVV